MRAFYGALEQRNVIYTPEFISQAELDAILASPMETGVIYDENGDVLAECGRGSNR